MNYQLETSEKIQFRHCERSETIREASRGCSKRGDLFARDKLRNLLLKLQNCLELTLRLLQDFVLGNNIRAILF